MNVLFMVFLVHASSAFVFAGGDSRAPKKLAAPSRPQRFLKPVPRRTTLAMNASVQKPEDNRKLYLEDLNQNYGSYATNQMENTNTNVYEMQSHNRRNAQLRQVGTWFGDVDLSVDDFRDTISQKLDQLNMSLQRPKIPVPGFGAAMTLPFATQQQGFGSGIYGSGNVRGITAGNIQYVPTFIQPNSLLQQNQGGSQKQANTPASDPNNDQKNADQEKTELEQHEQLRMK